MATVDKALSRYRRPAHRLDLAVVGIRVASRPEHDLGHWEPQPELVLHDVSTSKRWKVTAWPAVAVARSHLTVRL